MSPDYREQAIEAIGVLRESCHSKMVLNSVESILQRIPDGVLDADTAIALLDAVRVTMREESRLWLTFLEKVAAIIGKRQQLTRLS